MFNKGNGLDIGKFDSGSLSPACNDSESLRSVLSSSVRKRTVIPVVPSSVKPIIFARISGYCVAVEP